jgi:hypothetical protein
MFLILKNRDWFSIPMQCENYRGKAGRLVNSSVLFCLKKRSGGPAVIFSARFDVKDSVFLNIHMGIWSLISNYSTLGGNNMRPAVDGHRIRSKRLL